MANRIQYAIRPGVVIDAYGMVGETRVNHFHETAEIDYYIFDSEAARHQRVPDSEADRRRPLKIITVKPPIQFYRQYMAESEDAMAAAVYALITEVPEGSAAQPFGLAGLLTDAENV